MIRRPPGSTPFPYTTLSRSGRGPGGVRPAGPADLRGGGPAARARRADGRLRVDPAGLAERGPRRPRPLDRKSTRLNSSHANISYAVFCLKKKIKNACNQELM